MLLALCFHHTLADMDFSLMVLSLFLTSAFASIVDRAFTLFGNNEWIAAAAVLDEAAADDSALFKANNFSYLRGRIAENQRDWIRARTEFLSIEPGTPLRPLAAWHAALASVRVGDEAKAEELLRELPTDFPADRKLQIARESSTNLALKIYTTLTTRDARFARARLLNDSRALWNLLRETKGDDVGLKAAQLLSPLAKSPKEMLEVGETFVVHRQFDDALTLYQATSRDEAVAAESRFQIARIHFLRGDYQAAIQHYQAIVNDYPETEYEADSEYQIANLYWRLGDFKSSERAYLSYIARYGNRAVEDGAIRNLVDVYRVSGENQKALLWLDRALAKRLSLANRQASLFTKAKILYAQGRYAAALPLFQQLANTRLRSAPGGTFKDEARYFAALCLSKTGNITAARAIWETLAADRFSYYGVKASEKLGRAGLKPALAFCRSGPDAVLGTFVSHLAASRRAMRTEADPHSDAFTELLFLQLWDEAADWNEPRTVRQNYRAAAELSYAAGRYDYAIAYGNRLPPSDSNTMGLIYPAGFRRLVCAAAAKYDVDPLWLHAIIWQESKYNAGARSGASARGLMQFIPETAHAVAAATGISELPLDRLYEPATNIEMGAYYFASLMRELKSPEMALAAYNGGLDNVRRWKGKWPTGDDQFFVSDIGFVETKRYVIAVYGARAAYGAVN